MRSIKLIKVLKDKSYSSPSYLSYYLFAFLSFLSLRFSFIVFAGFFLSVFFESWPLDMIFSFEFICNNMLRKLSILHLKPNAQRRG